MLWRYPTWNGHGSWLIQIPIGGVPKSGPIKAFEG
jgi:hypothetical protein